MANNAINMCEKDILEDMLTSQKQITSNYNLFAGECAHTNLRHSPTVRRWQPHSAPGPSAS